MDGVSDLDKHEVNVRRQTSGAARALCGMLALQPLYSSSLSAVASACTYC